MILEINDKKIKVNIVYKNNKNIYMRFTNSNTLTVTCNPLVSQKKISEIIKKNNKSLIKMYQNICKEEVKSQYFWYLGRAYQPVFDNTLKKVSFDGEHIYSKDERMLQKFYTMECKRVFTNELKRIIVYFPNIPQFNLKIRYMKTRWGVNNQGNYSITLNSELLKKDIDLIDYVIIHELCHFYEPNHSCRFWQHVEQYYPKYKEARRRLRS